MSRIDTLQDDRGLLTCFQGAMVKDEWQQAYQTAHSVSTLDDFIYMINGDSWESSLTSFVEAVPSLKGNRIAVARFKSSFEAGRLALRQAATPATKSEDVDEVLPDGTMQQLNAEWTKRVPLGFWSVFGNPVNNCAAGFIVSGARCNMTVLDVKKIRSVLSMAIPRTQESVQLPGGLVLGFDKEVVATTRTVTEYYWALRILAHAWGWAGNYNVTWEGHPSSWWSSLQLWATLTRRSETPWTMGKDPLFGFKETMSSHEERWLPWCGVAPQRAWHWAKQCGRPTWNGDRRPSSRPWRAHTHLPPNAPLTTLLKSNLNGDSSRVTPIRLSARSRVARRSVSRLTTAVDVPMPSAPTFTHVTLGWKVVPPVWAVATIGFITNRDSSPGLRGVLVQHLHRRSLLLKKDRGVTLGVHPLLLALLGLPLGQSAWRDNQMPLEMCC